jgi:hypothetical protein
LCWLHHLSFFLSPGCGLVSARGIWCRGATCREVPRVEVPSEFPAQIPHHVRSHSAFPTDPLRRTFRRSFEPILPVTLRQEFVFGQSVHLVLFSPCRCSVVCARTRRSADACLPRRSSCSLDLGRDRFTEGTLECGALGTALGSALGTAQMRKNSKNRPAKAWREGPRPLGRAAQGQLLRESISLRRSCAK